MGPRRDRRGNGFHCVVSLQAVESQWGHVAIDVRSAGGALAGEDLGAVAVAQKGVADPVRHRQRRGQGGAPSLAAR